jgi:cytoskeletal protein CcmA (bactofilin family)
MGWFDQETKDGGAAPATAPNAPAVTPKATAPASSPLSSSTVGQRVQINGTIVSDEDLEIVGKVEGTINARKGLRVARDADVKAVINGSEILVEGTVTGDINASATLVLGATASLTGNIKTPSLQIREGAFFRGQVTMQSADTKEVKPALSARPTAAASTGPGSSSGDGSDKGATSPTERTDDVKSSKPTPATSDAGVKHVGLPGN